MSRKKLDNNSSPKVNKELEGFDIKIDPFGEINTTYSIDKINQFLNRHVDDKKLRDREDLDEIVEGKPQGKKFFKDEDNASGPREEDESENDEDENKEE